VSGRTPISTDERPKLASRCNILGKLEAMPGNSPKSAPVKKLP
jgi:hypothetical protein